MNLKLQNSRHHENLQGIIEAQARQIVKFRYELMLLDRRLCALQATMPKSSQRKTQKTGYGSQCRNPLAGSRSDGLLQVLQAREALKRCESRFKAFVDSSPDHIFVLDDKGVFLFSNDKVASFDLTCGQDLVGKRLQDVYATQTSVLYREKIQEVLHRGEIVSFHHDVASRNKLEHYIDTLFPIQYKDDQRCVGGISHDISKQKGIEKQLVQAQKMESLGTLVAGVAHEINNPINLILLNLPLFSKMWSDIVPLLERQLGSDPGIRIGGLSYPFIKENLPRLLADMDLAAQRVARITSGLKDFARKSNPAEKTSVQVNRAVENATRLAASTLKKSNASLVLDLCADLPEINANLQNLEQIVLNLMINALQAIDQDSGEVRIKTFFDLKKRSVVIEVADNGRGVNPAVADKIFDPFVTDRQADGGTGLGLSVSYNLVKAHQGDIFFSSKPDAGTTFSVVLPVSTQKPLYRIMVVDDDKLFRRLLIDAISSKIDGLVEGFENGAEALIRMGSYPPDLLILDMFMPQIDGLGVCKAIKNELGLALSKVIIVTGFPEHPSIVEARKMGFQKVFSKPLEIEYFIQAVRECLNGDAADQISHYGR